MTQTAPQVAALRDGASPMSAVTGWGLGGRTAAIRSVGLWLAALVILLAVFGPLLAPKSPTAIDFGTRLVGPRAGHWLGTDEAGRDVLSRVLDGARITLSGAAVVIACGAAAGVIIGTVAAIAGGIADELLMRITDIGMAFPPLILALGLAAALGASLRSAVIALAVTWWPRYARLVRAMVADIQGADYVTAARELGARRLWIVRRHILPATAGTMLVQVTGDVAAVTLTLAGLSFIGVGAQPPQPEWGAMISDGQANLPIVWWPVLFPGLALMLTAVSFSLAGDWLRDRHARDGG
ncbi:MAG TPA: ABC transporter permease [Streptosporangiaceae bacterium]|jgi:peptide/nickel transport system permease protein